jgi:radical SAM family uncharacterized protein/radical SAM-linked protein
VNKDWNAVGSRVCLAFPDVYDIGMSHLGTRILYGLLNANDGILCERAFAPWKDMEGELRARDLPLVSLESSRPLSEFDVVGFSLQYELTFTNVLTLLDLGGIALRSNDRKDDAPLILAGGPTATHPEPMGPFLDAILLGDGEERLVEIVELWTSLKSSGLSRRERLVQLAQSGNVYVPALYDRSVDARSELMVVDGPSEGIDVPFPIVRALVEDLNAHPFPDDSPEPVAEAIFERVSMEIARGCTEGCRFCQAGMIYRPVRERDPEDIVDTLVRAIEKGGYDEVGMTSLSTADFSCIAPLIKKVTEKLRERRVGLSVASLRAYGLADATLDDLKTSHSGGLTFAPEAGTQRMRDVINKNVTEMDITESAHRVFSKGWTRMKLYFMMGLPTEEDADLQGIVETGAKVQAIGYQFHNPRRVAVTVSVSCHVPKPHTPFQWCAMDPAPEIRRKHALLGDAARRAGVKVKWHDARVSHIEGILSRGDIRLADVIEAAWRNGARFDGWDECLEYDVWLQALEDAGIDPAVYLGTLPVDGGLPWDHLDMGLEDGFLAREYRRSLKDRLSPPCGKPAGDKVHHTNTLEAETDHRKLVCYNCGVACDMDSMRDERLEYLAKMGATTPPPEPPPLDEIPRHRGKPAPPERREQADGQRFRIQYTKVGPLRLTSHLDMVRKLPRVFRRAGLTMRMTEGYSPRPLMSYGPALPLGSWSIAEVLDATILDDVSPEELVERLNEFTPPGLHFLGARKTPPTDPHVARLVRYADFLVAVPGTPEEIDAALAKFLEAIEWPIERISRKSGRLQTVQTRALVEVLERVDSDLLATAVPELQDVEGPVVRVRLHLAGDGSIRPDELLANLLGLERLEPPIVVRTQLFCQRHRIRFGVLEEVPEPAQGPTSARSAEATTAQ